MADNVTLAELAGGLRRRWLAAAAVTLGFLLGAVLYGRSLPNQYESTVVVAFSPRNPSVGGDTVRVILPKYVAFATAPATINAVARQLPGLPSNFRSAVSASVQTDSSDVQVTVRLRSAQAAAAAANAMAAAIQQSSRADPLLEGVVVAPALPSQSPSGPPRTLLALAGLVVGAVAGVALAFLLERGRPRVRSWRDIGAVTGYSVVGRLPTSRAARMLPVEALFDPAVGASARTLRTNLVRLSIEHPVRTLVVTSPLGRDGKTTVASLLAVALARLDAEVLLVDGDLRHPRVAGSFGLNWDGVGGLSSVLRSDLSLADTLVPGPIPGLRLLPTYADDDAGDLLARHLPGVLVEAGALCDVVIVDAPTLLGGDDARTIATMCDGVLLVVSTDTLAASVGEAASVLDSLGVFVLGVVANRIRESPFRAYGGYFASST